MSDDDGFVGSEEEANVDPVYRRPRRKREADGSTPRHYLLVSSALEKDMPQQSAKAKKLLTGA